MSKRLLLLTTHFPGGRCPDWKTFEFKSLSSNFDLTIQPLFKATPNTDASSQLENVKILTPLLTREIFRVNKTDILLLVRMFSWNILIEIIFEGVFFSRRKISELLILLKKASFVNRGQFNEFIQVASKADIIYSYWGTGVIELLLVRNYWSLLNKTVVRLHGYDLYKERRESRYFPFRKRSFNHLKKVLAISEKSKKYLVKEFGVDINRIEVSRIGTKGFKTVLNPTEKPYLHIVSCAYIIPLKRIELILETVLQNRIFKWTHFGGGKEHDEWVKRIKHHNARDRIFLLGDCSKQEMEEVYGNSDFDLFLNVSTTEGVPVSIMEAMSAGLPIMATDVGGSSELVSTENGMLLSPELSVDELNRQLESFYFDSLENKIRMSKSSLNKFKQLSCIEVTQDKLLQILKDLF